MRTYQDYVNEVNAVMGIGPKKAAPIVKDYSNENAKLKKELKRLKEKESAVRQLYNNSVLSKGDC